MDCSFVGDFRSRLRFGGLFLVRWHFAAQKAGNALKSNPR